MKNIAILILLFASFLIGSCFDGTGEETGFTSQAFGSFYVENPYDTSKNSVQAFADTVGYILRIDTIHPLDTIKAKPGTLFINSQGNPDSILWIKTVGVDSAGWLPVNTN